MLHNLANDKWGVYLLMLELKNLFAQDCLKAGLAAESPAEALASQSDVCIPDSIKKEHLKAFAALGGPYYRLVHLCQNASTVMQLVISGVCNGVFNQTQSQVVCPMHAYISGLPGLMESCDQYDDGKVGYGQHHMAWPWVMAVPKPGSKEDDELAAFEVKCIHFMVVRFHQNKLAGHPIKCLLLELCLGSCGYTTSHRFILLVQLVCVKYDIAVIVDEAMTGFRHGLAAADPTNPSTFMSFGAP